MTTRRWMMAVATVGLLMGMTIVGYRLKRWHDHCIARAERHARTQATFESWRRASLARSNHIMASMSQNLDYHTAMARKYRHAARYPWLPIEPDPQEPEWPPSELYPQFQ
jgi:hypothetical protein